MEVEFDVVPDDCKVLNICLLSTLMKSNSLKSLTGKNGKENKLVYLFGLNFDLSKYFWTKLIYYNDDYLNSLYILKKVFFVMVLENMSSD